MLLVSLRVAGAWLRPPLVVVRVPRACIFSDAGGFGSNGSMSA